MINKISLSRIAAYGEEPENLTELGQVNFIFGTNGTGKTTISRVISDEDTHATCKIRWGTQPRLQTYVYNRDFLAKNFTQQMKGIFTLGEADAERIEELGKLKDRSTKLKDGCKVLEGQLAGDDGKIGLHGEASQLRERLENGTWRLKQKYDDEFNVAFHGLRNSKARFCDRVIEEYRSNRAEYLTLDRLREKASTLFASEPSSTALIDKIAIVDLSGLAGSPILTKVIVGSDGTTVAALIYKLGNSDWVREGLQYVPGSDCPCPFRQKPIETDLLESIRSFFGQTYLRDIDELNSFKVGFSNSKRLLEDYLSYLTSCETDFLDKERVLLYSGELRAKLSLNQSRIDQKLREPSRPVELEKLGASLSELLALVDAANDKIRHHITLVENFTQERKRLVSEVWKFIVEEEKGLLSEYMQQVSDLQTRIERLEQALTEKRNKLREVGTALVDLEISVTSVRPTVNTINRILTSFGFTGFSLTTAGEHDELYRIVRQDGSDAQENLSEGEKSFVSFLYFFCLVRGSFTSSGVLEERVVVFDDPVSSLDSEVLFVVGSLIKSLIRDVLKGLDAIKQVFVLSHNIYFFKEVTFLKNGEKCGKRTYWVVRTRAGVSKVEKHKDNPIKTSYEMLWAELKHPNKSLVTLPNVLRRIFEYYFEILGSIDKDTVIGSFEGHDQQICSSLLSWMNDGSHWTADDAYVVLDAETAERYLDVFKRVFEVTQHGAHYEMMIGAE